MEVITISSEAFKYLGEAISEINEMLKKKINKNPLEEKWLDIQDVCELLKISKRTLQSYRDYGILPYSQFGGKIYFKASDIDKYLNDHYVRIPIKK